MVLRMCRAQLLDPHDTHDAFQATFLILFRKPAGLWVRDSLGPLASSGGRSYGIVCPLQRLPGTGSMNDERAEMAANMLTRVMTESARS